MIDRIKELRMKGLSLKAICKGLRMSSSTVSKYIRGLRKNNNFSNNGVSEIIKTKWNEKRQKVIEEAISEFPEIRKDPEMMLFLGLYWGEGKKTTTQMGVSNNDPNIIRICYKIFRRLSPQKNLYIVVYCYPSHNKNICKKFWDKLLGKSVIVKDITDQRIKPLDYIHPRCLWGKCSISYNHFEVYWRIMTWIKMLGDS